MNAMNLIGWALFVVAGMAYSMFGAVPAMILVGAAFVSHFIGVYHQLRKKE